MATNEEIREQLEQGRTLPASWYTSPDVYELEKTVVFERFWHYVGRTDEVAAPGQYFTYRIGKVPIVVVRDTEGELRGFVNVCRHRGSEVVLEECGVRKSLQCHYHGWTYGLDGRLRAAPRSKSQPDFDADAHSLHPIRVETWGPFVFAHVDMDAPPLLEHLGVLPGLIEQTGVDVSKVAYRKTLDYEVAANWKVVAENFLECYHCVVSHPAFADMVDLDTFTVTPTGYVITEIGSMRDDVDLSRQTAYAPKEGEIQDGRYSFVWPGFMLNVFPGKMNMSTNKLVPLAVDRTLVRYEFFFVPEVDEEEETTIVDFAHQIQIEDVTICESVQRGMASGFYDRGTLFLAYENGPQYFQRLVLDALAERVPVEA